MQRTVHCWVLRVAHEKEDAQVWRLGIRVHCTCLQVLHDINVTDFHPISIHGGLYMRSEDPVCVPLRSANVRANKPPTSCTSLSSKPYCAPDSTCILQRTSQRSAPRHFAANVLQYWTAQVPRLRVHHPLSPHRTGRSNEET